MKQAAPWSPATCPRCGQANRCAMEAAREAGADPVACWCANLDFSAELLARLPTAAVGVACICESCARRAQRDPLPAA